MVLHNGQGGGGVLMLAHCVIGDFRLSQSRFISGRQVLSLTNPPPSRTTPHAAMNITTTDKIILYTNRGCPCEWALRRLEAA
jgi:hypothetical protein